MTKKLSKRKALVYGPHSTKGTLFIDDLSAPKPDNTGSVEIHQQIIQLLDSGIWQVKGTNLNL